MILQRLVEHYDRLASDAGQPDALPKPGYSEQKISFCVVLNRDGTLHQFQSMLDTGVKRPIPRRLRVPEQPQRSGIGIKPYFLWDNAEYMLGLTPNASDSGKQSTQVEAGALRKFEAFREKHLAVEPQVRSEAYSAVCSFLRAWSPELAERHRPALKGIADSFGVFRVSGEQRFVHDDPAVVTHWASQTETEVKDAPRGVCLVTGREAPIKRLHQPIKGAGGKSSGAPLVSFNEDAYTSFAKDQSFNAPVSVEAAFKYTNALNYLLNRQDRRVRLADTTVVFWAERPHRLERFVSDLLGDFPDATEEPAGESQKRAEETRLFVSQLREGSAGADPFDPEDQTRFFILGLSPNAARLSVRFWVDHSVAEMKERLAQHLRDIELVGARADGPPLTIWRLVAATGRAEVDATGRFKRYDTDSVSPVLGGAIARAVLGGGPYPQALLRTMLDRIRADGQIRHERAAAIKACLNRNARTQGQSWEVPVALDTERTEPGYITGRLFALLEKIQRDSSDGELNATIKDRYFGAASATPSFVFCRLIRLSQHHLAKLEVGSKIHYEKQLGEVMNKLNGFAHHFGLEDQGLFAIGYYHQQQALYTKKAKEEAEE